MKRFFVTFLRVYHVLKYIKSKKFFLYCFEKIYIYFKKLFLDYKIFFAVLISILNRIQKELFATTILYILYFISWYFEFLYGSCFAVHMGLRCMTYGCIDACHLYTCAGWNSKKMGFCFTSVRRFLESDIW